MATSTSASFIWMDGAFLPWENAAIHPMSFTLHYGMGVFEGLRVYETHKGPAIFRLEDHIERLFCSAKIINMKISYTPEEIIDAIIQTLNKNSLNAAYVRPMAYYGAEALGLHVNFPAAHLMIAAHPLKKYLNIEDENKGLRLVTSSFVRNHVNSMLLKAKINGSYVNSILAYQEALQQKCDDALMLDANGYVAEASTSNIFAIHKGVISTPSKDAIFPGITRDTIISLLKDQGLPILERNITRDELYTADEIFLTGSAAQVVTIGEIDGRILGTGNRGPITTIIQNAYHQTVHGESGKYKHWITLAR